MTWEELWPMKTYIRKGQYYVQLRDKSVGPFDTKKEAHDHVYALFPEV